MRVKPELIKFTKFLMENEGFTDEGNGRYVLDIEKEDDNVLNEIYRIIVEITPASQMKLYFEYNAADLSLDSNGRVVCKTEKVTKLIHAGIFSACKTAITIYKLVFENILGGLSLWGYILYMTQNQEDITKFDMIRLTKGSPDEISSRYQQELDIVDDASKMDIFKSNMKSI